MDVSELTLENQDTGERFNLVKEKIMISPSQSQRFFTSGGPARVPGKKDQEFSLPPQTEISYKLSSSAG